MKDDGLSKSINAAMVPILAALGCWGVDDGHWLPDRNGAPVLWLRTRTQAEQTRLQSQVWLIPQVQLTLMRLGVPHDVVWPLRVEITSTDAEAELFTE